MRGYPKKGIPVIILPNPRSWTKLPFSLVDAVDKGGLDQNLSTKRDEILAIK